jgi:hypothetical protein
MMFRICFFPVVLKVNALFFKPSLLALLSANWIGSEPEVSIYFFTVSTFERRKSLKPDADS